MEIPAEIIKFESLLHQHHIRQLKSHGAYNNQGEMLYMDQWLDLLMLKLGGTAQMEVKACLKLHGINDHYNIKYQQLQDFLTGKWISHVHLVEMKKQMKLLQQNS